MAEDNQVLRNVNWNEIFSFSQIFKSFKMAIHPSKLALCAAALVLMFVGGWVLDGIWSIGGGYVDPAAINQHATDPAGFKTSKAAWEDDEARSRAAAALLATAESNRKDLSTYIGKLAPGELKSAFEEIGRDKDKEFNPRSAADILDKHKEASAFVLLGKAEKQFAEEAEKIEDILDEAYDKAEKRIEDNTNLKDRQREKQLDLLAKHRQIALQSFSERKRDWRAAVKETRGEGISEAFLDYEWNCIRSAISAVWYGNITSGLWDYQRLMAARGPQPIAETDGFAPPRPRDDPPGFLVHTLMAYRGVVWLIQEHWVYAAVYLFLALCIWSLFGGAVSRIATMQFAREEKISIMQALRFSCGKFFSFFSAPLIPVALILILGLLLFLGALLMNIPVVGEIIVGILLLLALLLGLGIAFLLVGLVGGGALMYPTIAAEGSDSFDAISRSFSYLFTRPWRTILYSVVALVYGVVTYLFVRGFAFLALKATHYFAKWGVFVYGNELHADADKLDVVWTAPTFGSLFGPMSWDAMSGGQSIGAFIIGIWVFLVATLVMAYLLSYFASASSVIYFLLRRKVDATDLDDVYVEEEEEPVVPQEPAAPEAGEAGGEAKPAEEQKPDEEGKSGDEK
ncbi:MAG TPA: hypothetical protein VMZ50_03340 [Phycisphaerae bacterium]|nr:hypothetical protein [Phycisphaerae bacterium]